MNKDREDLIELKTSNGKHRLNSSIFIKMNYTTK